VEEEIVMEGNGDPIHHISREYSPFSPELEPNDSDGGPFLSLPTKMREVGILVRPCLANMFASLAAPQFYLNGFMFILSRIEATEQEIGEPQLLQNGQRTVYLFIWFLIFSF
jgi:hypothetical protein